jgi:Thioredoxin-like
MARPYIAAALALCAALATPAFAQEDVKQLVASRDKKLASPFLRTAGWTTSFDEARASAKASGKLIFAYFTRSYAPCGPCLQLEQTVLARPEFVEYSKNVVLFCHISTHIPSEPHGSLFAEKGGTGFPSLMVLDEDGNVLARQRGERTLCAVRGVVDEARAFAAHILSSASSDPETRYACLLKQVELGHFAPDEARTKVKGLGSLPADRQTRLETAITAREFTLATIEIRNAPDDASRLQAAVRLVEMKKAGHIPSDGNALAFWDWVIAYAAHTRDPGLYEDGLVATKKLLPDDASSRELCRERESTLDRMKRDVQVGGGGMMQRQ